MNNILIKIGAVVLASSLFVGCGEPKKEPQAPKIKKQKQVDSQGRPLWVSNPDMGGNIGVVSIVSKKKIKNKKKLYHIAKLKARAAFETRKGTKIDSTSTTKSGASGMSYSEKVNLSSNSIQTDRLVVKKTYEDKDNFYMWMVKKR